MPHHPKTAAVAIVLALTCTHHASPQLVNTDWSTPTSSDTIPGVLNGVGVTLVLDNTGLPAPGLSTFDFTTGEFADAPLGPDEEMVFTANPDTWTVTFDAPVTD